MMIGLIKIGFMTILAAAVLSSCHGNNPAVSCMTASVSSDSQQDGFGTSLAMSQGVMIVGAPWDDAGASDMNFNCGAVHVFEWGSDRKWTRTAVVRASDRQREDAFGCSVAISGGVMIVGAWNEDGGAGNPVTNSGAAYIFERDPRGVWQERSVLRSSKPQSFEYYGFCVAVDGQYAIVGAYNANDAGGTQADWSGAAYVYERQEDGRWIEAARLQQPVKQYESFFGCSVAISGNCAVVGARCNDGTAVNTGSVYVFERNPGGQWREKAILSAPGARANDYFGASVALSGKTLIVGAAHADGKGPLESNSGAAYVYECDARGSWQHQQTVTATKRSKNANFGCSVALAGADALIGEMNGERERGAADVGIVYRYTRMKNGVWKAVGLMVLPGNSAERGLGKVVATDGTNVAAGTGSGSDGIRLLPVSDQN